MHRDDKINILMVDDQPAKLISYEVMLDEIGENLIKANSAREALEALLKNEIAIILIDVCMPELDGFELAAMIREHPRFQETAIIFISAIHLADDDRLRGYRMGAVDYMPVPVVPEILRAKVKVFAELYRKTRELERLNRELEIRVAERTADLEGSNARLAQSEEQLRLATNAAEIGLWDVDEVTGNIFWEDRVKQMFGISPDMPVSMADFYAGIHQDDRERIAAAFNAARDPKIRAHYDVEYRTVGKEDGDTRWIAAKGRGVFSAEGRCIRVIGTALDITERKRADEHHALLAREVDHRAKNALAVVQSIVRLTRAPSTSDYVRSIEGRIRALSRAHTLLSESRWKGASLKSLTSEELAPYGIEKPGRITFEGTNIELEPASAQSLALVLHELATNSAKYGSLSQPEGKLAIDWSLQDGNIVLEWREQGGPPVSKPASNGFGLSVIRASVETQLRGSLRLDWRRRGLHCRITIPGLRGFAFEDAHVPLAPEPENPSPPEKSDSRRVLVVEDETLVALMLQEALADVGIDIVGPCGSVGEAMRLARANTFSAAVLDVNLGGEQVYEVAEYLATKSVPFVFMTGYARESIDSRFADAPVLHKPVDLDLLCTTLIRAARGRDERETFSFKV